MHARPSTRSRSGRCRGEEELRERACPLQAAKAVHWAGPRHGGALALAYERGAGAPACAPPELPGRPEAERALGSHHPDRG